MRNRRGPGLGFGAGLLATLLLLPGSARGQGAVWLSWADTGQARLTAPGAAFLAEQLDHPRVRVARDAVEGRLRSEFEARRLPYPPAGIFLRIFKRERIVELWVRPPGTDRYTLFKSYPMCVLSGDLGPKREAGDYQVPEGFYYLTYFNPSSDYLLSLGISYPNRADWLRSTGTPPGGDIFIHGGCRTIGCVPMKDEQIQELYWVAVEARAAGQQEIPVHIFPTRLDAAGLAWLDHQYAKRADLRSFWHNLQPGYEAFEDTHRVPLVAADEHGLYVYGARAQEAIVALRSQRAGGRAGPPLLGRAAEADAPPQVPMALEAARALAAPGPGIARPPDVVGGPRAARVDDGAAAGVGSAAQPAAPDSLVSAAQQNGTLAGHPAPFQMRPLEHGLIQAAPPASDVQDPAARRAPAKARGRKSPPLLGRPIPPAPDTVSGGAGR